MLSHPLSNPDHRAPDSERREMLKAGGAAAVFALFAAAGLVPPAAAQSGGAGWNAAAFSAHSLQEVLKAYGGAGVAETKEVNWGSTPEIAENGAVVPVGVSSRLPDTQAIVIVVEKNPNPLAAVFTLPAGTLADLQTRVKMAETCKVFALVKAAGRYAYTAKEVKVTLGGCGG